MPDEEELAMAAGAAARRHGCRAAGSSRATEFLGAPRARRYAGIAQLDGAARAVGARARGGAARSSPRRMPGRRRERTSLFPSPLSTPARRMRLPEDAVCRSPIAGQVIAVLAAAGESVTRRQPVMVIEAMKMQNNVGAEVDGVLKAVHVSPGDAVKAGQVLFELV